MDRERFELSTLVPCSQSWDAMAGNSQQRHCAECSKTVHNLAWMTRQDVELLAMRAAAGIEVCARVTRNVEGVLMMQPDAKGRGLSYAAPVILSAALAAGLPAVGQSFDEASSGGTAAPLYAKGEARVTGRVLKPNGSPVDTGLIYLRVGNGDWQWFVVDSLGTFEFRVRPGYYDFGVQTGAAEAQRMPAVLLHEGEQSFGDVRTQAGRVDLDISADSTLMGAMTATYSWSWRLRLRHPLLYLRSVARRSS